MIGTFKQLTTSTKHVVVDIETKDPYLKTEGPGWIRRNGYVLGVACKFDNEPSEYYPVRHISDNLDCEHVRQYFFDLFKTCKEQNIKVIGHYLQYDLGWLDHEKFLDITKCPPLFCSLIGGQLMKSDLRSYALAAMGPFLGCGNKLNIDPEQLSILPTMSVAKYACQDTDLTYAVAMKEMQSTFLIDEAVERENAILPIVVQMKKNGIRINEERMAEIEKEYKFTLQECQREFEKFDPTFGIWRNASAEFMFRRLGLAYPRTEAGNASFTKSFLETIPHPLVQKLALARRVDKCLSFVRGIQAKLIKGKIHSDYFNGKSDDGGTITGRFSCANPNQQQIPIRTEEGKKMRSIFEAHTGQMWAHFDYKQQEPIMAMHFASRLGLEKIDEWKELYENNPNQDFYDPICQMTGIERQDSKTCTLALMYYMGIDHMAEMLGVTKTRAIEINQLYYDKIPWMPKLRDKVMDRIDQAGCVKTVGNRYLQFNNMTRQKGFNHLIQGSSADQTKAAMVAVYREMGMIPLNQVHDELNYGLTLDVVNEGIDEEIRQLMKEAIVLDFPTTVDYKLGSNWGECK